MPASCHYAHSCSIPQNGQTKRYKYEIGIDILKRIKAEKQRTGISPISLLRSLFHCCPPELSADMINNWVAGRTKRAYWEHVNWVLEQYSAIPDKLPAEVSDTV